jgi:GNAT superfamily N-acetyltransferase
MSDSELLDNPIWHALITEQSKLAVGDKLARTYQPEIGPLSGIVEESTGAYESLRSLAVKSGPLGLFLSRPYEGQPGWKLLRGEPLNQMIFSGSGSSKPNPFPSHAEIRPLLSTDVPAMVELAKLTEPGPFRNRTNELGAFFGIFESSRLLAMAGERMRVPGFIEVSAVCTHPDARGRGYARTLMSTVMDDIFKQGATPFLHVLPNNPAIRIYESLGFIQRRVLHLAVIKNEQ